MASTASFIAAKASTARDHTPGAPERHRAGGRTRLRPLAEGYDRRRASDGRLAGTAVSAWSGLGRGGDEFLRVHRERGGRRALSVRRGRKRGARRNAGADGLQLALLPPRRRPRLSLRLSRA